jgi:exosortase C (VPDSG-CTERM-specific)
VHLSHKLVNELRTKEAEPDREKVSRSPALPRAKRGVSGRQNLELEQRARLLGCLVCSALLTALYFGPLFSLMLHAATTDLDSHILLVPLISAYLLYIRRKQLPGRYSSSPLLATVFLIGGLAACSAASGLLMGGPRLSANDYLALMASSFVCLLTTIGFFFLGRKWMAAAAFAIAFLIFIIPLPDRAVQWLETASKLASTDAAQFFFLLSGTPVTREGTVLQLPGIVFEVAQECSGFHSTWALFMSSLLVSHLFLRSPWRRTLLVAFVVPLGIARNGFRILVIGLLCVHVGPQMIHSVIHRQGGPVFFVLSLIPMFLLLWWFRSRETGAQDRGRSLERAYTKDSES